MPSQNVIVTANFEGGMTWSVSAGAEGYDKDGNLAISKNSSGTIEDTAGMIVFLDVKDYGNVSASGGIAEVLIVATGGGFASIYGGGGDTGGFLHIGSLLISVSSHFVFVGNGATINRTAGQDSLLGVCRAFDSGSTDSQTRLTRGGGSGGGGNGVYGGCG